MKYFYFAMVMHLCFTLNAQFITNSGISIHNSAYVTTNGDWTNDASTRLTNHGVISTSDAFINQGILDEGSRGGFDLRFDTDLNFQPGGSTMGFLTKNGPGTALVTGTIGVRDSLLLKGGLLRLLDPRDTVVISDRAVLLSGENAYVDNSLVSRTGKGDLVFPLGKDGLYLPLKIYKVNAQKITASLDYAPAGHTAGPGVDALIDYPYVYHVIKKHESDTAGYVEINYPSTLPVVGNPIVVREIPGQEYASMGARLIQDSGSRVTVKSYSRRLEGTFTIGQGFPSDPVTDSLALVSLYESTGGSGWTNATNWLESNVENWFGVTVHGQSITGVELPGNNLNGPVADPLVDILSLQTINLSANKITALPDFTLNPEITSLNVSDNNLDFASLEPNAAIVGINYFIQGDLGTPVDSLIEVGTPYQFSVDAGGTTSEYKWKFNGADVSGATSTTYMLPSINRTNMGEYHAEITNPALPGLILKSAAHNVLAYAQVSGKLYADTQTPAASGELTLYRVQPGAFQPVETIDVASDGSFVFEKVVLDDYQLRGFADTLMYESALPTYYESTIFWEEADTLFLEGHVSAIDIFSQVEPGPPSGRGTISGVLQEDDGTGRVMDPEKNKKIAKAGVAVRRVEHVGRTKEEILTLVAYVFTNDEGEFTFPNLPTGEYRLTFEYPGYPMDHTTYTTVTIGTGFESQVMVEANVVEGKIKVDKVIITGVFEAENYHAQVFPNPAVERIQISFAGEVKGRLISLVDMQGRVISMQQAEQKQALVDVSAFRKGIYFLQVNENGRKVKVVKISIEK